MQMAERFQPEIAGPHPGPGCGRLVTKLPTSTVSAKAIAGGVVAARVATYWGVRDRGGCGATAARELGFVVGCVAMNIGACAAASQTNVIQTRPQAIS